MSDKIILKLPKGSIEATVDFSEHGFTPIHKYVVASIAKILSKSYKNLDFGDFGNLMAFPEPKGVEFEQRSGNVEPCFYDIKNPRPILVLKKTELCRKCQLRCFYCPKPLVNAIIDFAQMTQSQRENLR
jgi:hypothetical protein